MYTAKEIGEKIRHLRGDLSLRDFAKKCDISHTTIDNLEKGIDFRTKKPTQVKMATLQKIADACLVPVSYLTGEQSDELTEDQLKIALFGANTEVTDEMWQRVKDFARFLTQNYNN